MGKPFREAIFAPPNCTKKIGSAFRDGDMTVSMGRPLDGVSPTWPTTRKSGGSSSADRPPDDVVAILKEPEVDILVNYLPVGSEEAAQVLRRRAAWRPASA